MEIVFHNPLTLRIRSPFPSEWFFQGSNPILRISQDSSGFLGYKNPGIRQPVFHRQYLKPGFFVAHEKPPVAQHFSTLPQEVSSVDFASGATGPPALADKMLASWIYVIQK